MKQILAGLGFVVMGACGGKSAPGGGGGGGASAPAVKLSAVALDACGDAFKGMTIQAPEGSVAAESFGSCSVKAGAKYELEIGTEADLANVKKEAQANDVQKLKRFVVDSPELVLIESEAMGKTFFFVRAAPKVGGATFRCDSASMHQDEAEAQTLAAACKSLAKK